MFSLKDKEGKEVAAQTAKVGGNGEVKVNFDIKNPLKWTAETPNLYTLYTTLMDGKQVAILVPTTVLAQQHYQTAVSRFRGFPVNVDVLSRFRTPKQQAKTLQDVRSGSVDVIIGTHKLLQKSVQFKDLGLLVVDEEQRFGVTHKERLKEISKGVDVLTLSATPIPRTLNMALSGIRDMSTIEAPPADRYPVQTFVMEYNTAVIDDAIRREVDRGGQVFYLHNRTETIDQCASALQKRIPGLRIGIAHGQMTEEALGEVMTDMAEGEIDVLICTTIIETGLDIPNANTLIIENADRFGLSQLHQLRGRVGRSTRHAYAYFTYRPDKNLTEVAEKRLSAIRDFAEFGSGFKIAMRDLEIRGAGNLLGAEQSGHMMSVGYDLYLKLLEEAVQEEKGETPKPLAKIASGGELSRIMLALQCVTADQDAIPTMIFDEIDTGVSGKAAQKIGMKLREVSKNHQVLCVTHLAQIAVMGEHHFMIEKKVQDGRTQTFVQPLDAAGRIAEIARIMGGESPSSLLLKTAQEELQKWRNLS